MANKSLTNQRKWGMIITIFMKGEWVCSAKMLLCTFITLTRTACTPIERKATN